MSDKAPYGLVIKLRAQPGKRAGLMEALRLDLADLPGCRAYILSADLADQDAVWLTEYWDTKEAHDVAVELPVIKEMTLRTREFAGGLDLRAEVEPAF